MQKPIRILVKDVPNVDDVRTEVRAAAAAIERFHDHITSCQVSIDNPEARHKQGGLYRVHIRLGVPGRDSVEVSRMGQGGERAHLRVALRLAFAQARRRLQDVVRRQRGDVKKRAQPKRPRRAKKAMAA
jgi:hypothetical protein